MSDQEDLKHNKEFVEGLHYTVIREIMSAPQGQEFNVCWNKKLGQEIIFQFVKVEEMIPKGFVRIGTIGALNMESYGVNTKAHLRDSGQVVYEIDDGLRGNRVAPPLGGYSDPKFWKKFRRSWIDSSLVMYDEMIKYLYERSIDEHWFTQMVKIASHEYNENQRGVEDVRAGF